jgi:hypothetical protein
MWVLMVPVMMVGVLVAVVPLVVGMWHQSRGELHSELANGAGRDPGGERPSSLRRIDAGTTPSPIGGGAWHSDPQRRERVLA